MSVIGYNQLAQEYMGLPQAPKDVVAPTMARPGFGELVSAEFATNSWLGAMASNAYRRDDFDRESDPNFKPLADLPPGYDEYLDVIGRARSPRERDAIIQQLHREIASRDTIARSSLGASIAASAVSGLVSPDQLAMMFIPVLGEVKVAKTIGGIALSAFRTAAVATAGQAVEEYVLHRNELLRTQTETAVNLGSTALLSAAVGGGVSVFKSGGMLRKAGKSLDEAIQPPEGVGVIPSATGGPDYVIVDGDRLAQDGIRIGHWETRTRVTPAETIAVEDVRGQGRFTEAPIAGQSPREVPANPADFAPGYLPESLRRYPRPETPTVEPTVVNLTPEKPKMPGLPSPLEAPEGPYPANVYYPYQAPAVPEPVLDPSGNYIPIIKDKETYRIIRPEERQDVHRLVTRMMPSTETIKSSTLAGAIPEPDFIPDLARVPKAEDVGVATVIDDAQDAAVQASFPQRYNLKSRAGSKSIAKLVPAPVSQLAFSWARSAREFIYKATTVPFQLEGEALPIDVRTLTRQNWIGPNAENMDKIRSLYKTYAKRVGRGVAISLKEFGNEVQRAARRFDAHDIPEVAQSASILRKFFEAAKNASLSNKAIADDFVLIPDGQSYFPRNVNSYKVLQEAPQFEARIAAHLQKLGKTAEEAARAARALREAYTGGPANRYFGRSGLTGHLRERTNLLPDEVLEPWLDDDLFRSMDNYAKSIGADIEVAKMFGDLNATELVEKITKEYNDLIAAADTAAKRDAMKRERDVAIQNVRFVLDDLRGMAGRPADPYSAGARVGAGIRALTYAATAGKIVLSQFSDYGAPILRHKLLPVVKNGLLPMVSNWNGIKASNKELHLAGAALEWIQKGLAHDLYDLQLSHSTPTWFEAGLQKSARGMNWLNGMVFHQSIAEQYVGRIVQHDLLQDAIDMAKGRASKFQAQRLADYGVNEAMARRIGEQMAGHGMSYKGLLVANTEAWTDDVAVNGFRAGLLKGQKLNFIRPDPSDKVKFASSGVGKVIMQYMSYSQGATSYIAMAALQRHDRAVLEGVVAMVGLGMLSYAVRQKIDGMTTSDDPNVWLTEGIRRSGVLGILPDLDDAMSTITNGTIGISPWLGNSFVYRRKDALSTIAGPGIPKAISGITAGGGILADAISGRPLSPYEVHRIRTLFPYNQVMGLSALFDRAEESVNWQYSDRAKMLQMRRRERARYGAQNQ